MNIQLPLLPQVKLQSAFVDILGTGESFMPEQIRRQRWAQWLKQARRAGESELAKDWTSPEACIDEDRGKCVHLRGKWCALSSLPASVNPILSFRHGLVGMACMGIGFTAPSPKHEQATMFGGER
jgi:hypothetical protein